MQKSHEVLAERNVRVIAIAQEDTDLASHAKFLDRFPSPPPFPIVADIGRVATTGWDRTTTYIVDDRGIVRQVFPQTVRERGSWEALLAEIDRLGLR